MRDPAFPTGGGSTKPRCKGDENGLCSIGRSGFGEDARHVDADGFLDDAEVIANLFIAPAEHDR